MAQAGAKQSSTGQIEVIKATMAQPYLGVIPLATGSGNCPNGLAMVHLTPTQNSTAYLCGFIVTGSGSVGGSLVLVTVEGLLGGTRSFCYGFEAGVNKVNTPLAFNFNPPLIGVAPGAQILLTVPAGGTGNLNSMATIYGYAATAAPTPDI
jgi:hypothetical protein